MSSPQEVITRVFFNGNSQAVRIPKEFQFDSTQVRITREGDSLKLTPVSSTWVDFFNEEEAAPDDFMDFDRDELPQKRALF